MPDLAQLRHKLLGRFRETQVDRHLASFDEEYCTAFEPDDVARHLELIAGLSDAHPVFTDVRPAGDHEWTIAVVGYDAFQFLATVCMLLAVRGLSIQDGRVFTSSPPPREPSRRAHRPPTTRLERPMLPPAPLVVDLERRPTIVDVFRVRQLGTSGSAPDWAEFQTELAELTQRLRGEQFDEVDHRLIGRFVAALEEHRTGPSGLEPLDLTIDSAASALATVVQVRARDAFGFLSLTARALALCGIRIVQANVRTVDDRADDTLWVTDRSGRPITAEPQLRQLRLSLILIEHFSSFLPHASDPTAALIHFSRFATDTMARDDWALEFEALDRPEVLDALVRVLGESDFLWEEYLHAQPDNILPMICDPSQWSRRRDPNELDAELDAALRGCTDRPARRQAIRRFEDREIFRADVRSILGKSNSDQFAAELTDVAEVLLRAAYRLAIGDRGATLPHRLDGTGARSTLMALGKFGGRELGFASDLELMLIYDDRDLADQSGGVTAGESFDRLVSDLRDLLADRRGGTFELDFRLRPYGKGGPPATSFAAFAGYYQPHGAAWGYERQALVKLRAVAGDDELGREVELLRDQFIYGPVPFDLPGYRRLRQLQVKQQVQPGTINAKFSPGALVDVEYFVQALQISWGAGDPSVRSPNTLDALLALQTTGHIDGPAADNLRLAYRFFRTLIDALRVVRGHAHDLTVPPADTQDFAILARRLRRGPAALAAELDNRLQAIASLTSLLGEYIGVAAD